MMPLILASASPQRKQLLQATGLDFEVIPSTYDESQCTEQNAARRAVQLACAKAEHVAAYHPDAVVIGCDTLVVASDGTLLEKPVDAADAKRMITLQSGTTSVVHSGLCVVSPTVDAAHGLSSSEVTFKKLTEEEIAWWIGINLWQGRSGSFQIDGCGQLMIEQLVGDWSSVVGLPVFLLGKLLKQVGYPIL